MISIWEIWVDEEGRIVSGWISNRGARLSGLRNTKEVIFGETGRVATEKGGFAAELVYSGISNSTLRVSYREYVNDMAQPAYSQELTYNLSESNIITFRSVKIKISHADNSEIEYSVEEDNDLPWVPRNRKLSIIG